MNNSGIGLLILASFSILLNGITIVVMVTGKRSRLLRCFKYFVNLLISHMCHGFLEIFVYVAKENTAVVIIHHSLLLTTLMMLASLAIDRMIAIKYPFAYSSTKWFTVAPLIVMPWFVTFILVFVGHFCRTSYQDVFSYALISLFSVTFFILVWTNISVFFVARRQIRRIRSSTVKSDDLETTAVTRPDSTIFFIPVGNFSSRMASKAHRPSFDMKHTQIEEESILDTNSYARRCSTTHSQRNEAFLADKSTLRRNSDRAENCVPRTSTPHDKRAMTANIPLILAKGNSQTSRNRLNDKQSPNFTKSPQNSNFQRSELGTGDSIRGSTDSHSFNDTHNSHSFNDTHSSSFTTTSHGSAYRSSLRASSLVKRALTMGSIKKRRDLRKEVKAAYICIGLVFSFLVLWGPFIVVYVINLVTRSPCREKTLHIVRHLALSNGLADPVLSVLLNKELRVRVCKIFTFPKKYFK